MTRRQKIGACGGATILTAWAMAAWALDTYGQRDQAQQAQAIVVLGARVNEAGKAGRALRERTLHAVELYHRGFAPIVIFSGGVGDNPPSEAQVAATLATKRGVPKSAIILENASHSTWQNARNVARLCHARGWKRVIVVSDSYHLWRAKRNFAAAGLIAFPSSCANAETRVRYWMAACETLSVARDFLWRR